MRVKVIVWNFVRIDWGGFWVLILETSFCWYVMILHDMVHEGFGSLNGLGGFCDSLGSFLDVLS